MDRYSNIKTYRKPSKNNTGKVYRGTTAYPIIPHTSEDIYVITVDGDRLDVLSQQYYNDKSLWWILSTANVDLPQNSLYIPAGTQLRIPTNVQGIVTLYRELNNI